MTLVHKVGCSNGVYWWLKAGIHLQGQRGLRYPTGRMEWCWVSHKIIPMGWNSARKIWGWYQGTRSSVTGKKRGLNVVMDHRRWAIALWQWKKNLWSLACSRRVHLERDAEAWTFLYKAVRDESGIVYISSGHALKKKKGICKLRKVPGAVGMVK